MEGAYARQGRCRAAPAGQSLHNADRRIGVWSRRSAVDRRRRAADGDRNNRRVCSETVEDHDRRFWYRWPLTWRSSHAFTVLNTTQFHVRRLGADLARREPAPHSIQRLLLAISKPKHHAPASTSWLLGLHSGCGERASLAAREAPSKYDLSQFMHSPSCQGSQLDRGEWVEESHQRIAIRGNGTAQGGTREAMTI
jgi:hypothetical protein